MLKLWSFSIFETKTIAKKLEQTKRLYNKGLRTLIYLQARVDVVLEQKKEKHTHTYTHLWENTVPSAE